MGKLDQTKEKSMQTMTLVERVEAAYVKKGIPDFRPGDTIRIFVKIKEGEKERLQAYEGVLIRYQKGGTRATLTVRKISYGVGVERIFPLHSPVIDHIEVVQHGKVRRARLYYLRGLSGRKARIEEDVQGDNLAETTPEVRN